MLITNGSVMHRNRCKKPIVSANADSSQMWATIKSEYYKFEMSVKVQAHTIIFFKHQTHALIYAFPNYSGYI